MTMVIGKDKIATVRVNNNATVWRRNTEEVMQAMP